MSSPSSSGPRREQRHGHRLEREKRNQNRALALDEEEGEPCAAVLREDDLRERQGRSTRHRVLDGVERIQEHGCAADGLDDEYQRRKFLATAELVGADPREALRLA